MYLIQYNLYGFGFSFQNFQINNKSHFPFIVLVYKMLRGKFIRSLYLFNNKPEYLTLKIVLFHNKQ